MNDVLPDLQKWIDRGDRIAIATVVAVKKSAPRPPGAKMAVNEDGEIIGAVSGGCVEGAVVEIADEVLRGQRPQLVHFGIADVPVVTDLDAVDELGGRIRDALSEVEMSDDLHGSARYRRHLAEVLGTRAVARAVA